MPLQGNLSIERMCELTRVSRASFYRSFHKQQPVEEELEVRSAIQQIAIEHRRRYGYRRISAELRRRGMQVNHKRVMRIMAEDNLLAVQPKSFVMTTNSHHEFEVYLNLASPDEADRDQSAVGRGYHLHSIAAGVCFLGGDSRRFFPESGGMALGSHVGGSVAAHGAGASDRGTET
jgi:transposase InsO family protein